MKESGAGKGAQALYNNIIWSNVHMIGVPEGKETNKWVEEIFVN